MTDVKLLEITNAVNKANSAFSRLGYPEGVEVAISENVFSAMPMDKRSSKEIENYLSNMDEKDLNELRVVIAIGNYFRTERAKGIKASARLSLDDLTAWRDHLGVKQMTHDDCVKDIMKRSLSSLISNIDRYLDAKPMNKTRRGLVNVIKAKQHLHH